MKRILLIRVVLLLPGGAAVFFTRGGGSPAETGAKQLYTCGMHPQTIKDKPGDCPIWGMKPQPIRK